MSNIEQLLSVPMYDIEDQGFSADVVSKIAKFNHLRIYILTILYTFLAVLFIAFFPVLTWLKVIKTFIYRHIYSTANFPLNSQVLTDIVSQPAILLTLSMTAIYIFTRLEN
ncbi:MAG: hypothetical protein MJK12_03585 [Colwellia sp.]|nr:hypothetical protein [Colwellia sp.]